MIEELNEFLKIPDKKAPAPLDPSIASAFLNVHIMILRLSLPHPLPQRPLHPPSLLPQRRVAR